MRIHLLAAAVGQAIEPSELIHDISMTVGRASGIHPSGFVYGFRQWGSYNYGTLSNAFVNGKHAVVILGWYDYTSTMVICMGGDQTATIRIDSIQIGSVVYDFKTAVATFNEAQSMTYWQITLTSAQRTVLNAFYNTTVAVKIMGVNRMKTGPWYNHDASLTVGRKTVAGQDCWGYRSPADNPIGTLTPLAYIGRAALQIINAQYNATSNQFQIIVQGVMPVTGLIRQVKLGNQLIDSSRFISEAYESANGWTRLVWGTEGLPAGLGMTVGQTIDLKF